MRKLQPFLCLLVCALVGGAAAPASATLIGDTIQGSLVFTDYPGLGNCFDPADVTGCRAPGATGPFAPDSGIQPSAVVSDTDASFLEFVFDDKGYLIVWVDVDADDIHVRVENTSTIPPSSAQTPLGWEIELTDLDWSGAPGTIETADVVDDALFPGLTAEVIDGGTGVRITFPGRHSATDAAALAVWNAEGEFNADVALNAVPEPARAFPLALGLAALARFRRR